MWWILSALLVLIVWALKLILGFAIWIPEAVTAAMLVLGIALFIFKRVRASQAAGALERAIAQQGAQQALNARPERRAEIQELQKQVQTGISALKSSKLGGRKGGASALYSLPWYVIIGPPGAGKTTALKHSGLVFPYADPSGGGGVRGVGGTRNCDWWFTNEAILLDTAGRYTTESDDHDEWIAFLQMLRRYRTRRPINGILVAINVAELIDANEQQLEATGKKLRARIDEVMTQLHMVVPVYVLFTKCDLIAGFGEFFNDLRKSDRAQAWGTTLRLDLVKNEPGKLFDAEFDILTKQVHAKALKRLAVERNREAREKIYQFPLEFAGIKRNLSELIGATFQVNAFQGTPIFRGFYFTSGTQEGRPLDRVLGRMGQAMGIRTQETVVQQVVESKSYFLHDVFMNIVFPDGDVAARSASEVRRQALMRISVSLSAAALAVIMAIPAVVSFLNNRTFVRETEDRARAANAINWGDGTPASTKVTALKPVLDRLLEIDGYRSDLPLSMGWMMYQGETVYRPAVAVYVSSLQRGFVIPCKQKLEERLKQVKGDKYLSERQLLKTYLMLSDLEHLDVEWATGRFTQLWADVLRSTSNMPEDELKKMLAGHVHYYFQLLADKKVQPVPPNAALIESTRKTLEAVPVQKRYYDLFVNALIDIKNDEAIEASRANTRYPSLRLDDLFGGSRTDALKAITSARYLKEKIWKEVEGPYTDKGHYAVVKNIATGAGLLEAERWVVPLTDEEKGDRVPVNLRHLAEDYDQHYIDAWTDFMTDLVVQPPSSVKDAIELYTTLARPDWPYLRILHALEDHTQWKKDKSVFENQELTALANNKIKQQLAAKTGGLRFDVDLKKLGDRVSAVPGTFKRTVEFGVPVDTRAGAGTAPITETPLAKYIGVLTALRDEMQKQFDANPAVDVRLFNDRLTDASNQLQAALQPFDDKAKQLLSPLLINPLRVGTTRLPGIPAMSARYPVPGRGVR